MLLWAPGHTTRSKDARGNTERQAWRLLQQIEQGLTFLHTEELLTDLEEKEKYDIFIFSLSLNP